MILTKLIAKCKNSNKSLHQIIIDYGKEHNKNLDTKNKHLIHDDINIWSLLGIKNINYEHQDEEFLIIDTENLKIKVPVIMESNEQHNKYDYWLEFNHYELLEKNEGIFNIKNDDIDLDMNIMANSDIDAAARLPSFLNEEQNKILEKRNIDDMQLGLETKFTKLI